MPYRLAEFSEPEHLLGAARALRDAGYVRLDAHTPFAVPGLAEVIGLPPSRAPLFIFGGGVVGGSLGYLVQWWCNAIDYPLNVGGRPLHSIPTQIPITFELTVLGAASTAFVYLILSAGLPRLFHRIDTVPGIERATLDAHVLAIDLADPKFVSDACTRILEAHHVVRIIDGEPVR
jgi:ActD protein